MRHCVARRLSLFVLAMGLFAAPGLVAQETVTVAAASDLQFALGDVADAFRDETGQSVDITFGSSGNFYRQIRQGAPFDLYLAADEQFVLDLAEDGLTPDQGVIYAIGRIVIIAPNGSPLAVDPALDGLRTALAGGRIERFAIPNPEHAPYGGRAEEALRHAGLWDALEPRLVLGENVSQAAQFAVSGSVQGGIIAYSLALSPRVSALARYALIPIEWHRPLRQRMVLLNRAGPTARQFYDFLRGPIGRMILARHGFAAADEAG